MRAILEVGRVPAQMRKAGVEKKQICSRYIGNQLYECYVFTYLRNKEDLHSPPLNFLIFYKVIRFITFCSSSQ